MAGPRRPEVVLPLNLHRSGLDPHPAALGPHPHGARSLTEVQWDSRACPPEPRAPFTVSGTPVGKASSGPVWGAVSAAQVTERAQVGTRVRMCSTWKPQHWTPGPLPRAAQLPPLRKAPSRGAGHSGWRSWGHPQDTQDKCAGPEPLARRLAAGPAWASPRLPPQSPGCRNLPVDRKREGEGQGLLGDTSLALSPGCVGVLY